jgi:NTP pyrophosphatase (non-canonical NTP hydrolase)
MDFNEYQEKTKKTAGWAKTLGQDFDFVYPVLGLVGEAGEVAEKIKKVLRDEGGVVSDAKREEIKKELGDVLWYIAQIGVILKIELNDIAESNIQKTYDRLERGKLSGSGDNR